MMFPRIRVVLLTTLALICGAADCVPAGGSLTVTIERPPLPAGVGGLPSRWTNDAPAVYECDTFADDFLGSGGPIGATSGSIEIRNHGGSLIGPTGTTLNGGLEGNCIEIKMCWNARVAFWHYYTVLEPNGGGGVLVTYRRAVYRTVEVCSDCVEVCPCES